MTAEIVRFPLVEPIESLAGTDELDCSRDWWDELPFVGKVGATRGVPIRTLSPDFVISTRSSSESLATPLLGRADLAFSFFSFKSHFPSG